jgi:hypothetical protein
MNIIKKDKEIEDKSVSSNIIKEKKLHIYTMNNVNKILCDNKKLRK